MSIDARNVLVSGVGCLLLATCTLAFAQSYPTKAIRYIVPFAAGGGVDTLTRVVAAKLNAAWNVPVIVENRPGAGGNIGTEHVAYKGIAPAVADLLGGHVSLSFSVVPAAYPHIKTGKLRALAVSSAARSALFPEFPTIAEAGLKGFDAFSWYATLAPAGTPQAVINKLNSEIVKSLHAPDANARLASVGLEVKTSTPEEFGRFMIKDWAVWDKVIRSLEIRAG